jgi:hypothetical protein
VTLALEHLGAELVEMLVALHSILYNLDVNKDFELDPSPCFVNPRFDLLAI